MVKNKKENLDTETRFRINSDFKKQLEEESTIFSLSAGAYMRFIMRMRPSVDDIKKLREKYGCK